MNDIITEKIVIVLSILFIVGLIIYNIDNNPDGVYKVDLRNEPISVCGEEIYFSNDADGDELDIDDIIENIKYACNK